MDFSKRERSLILTALHGYANHCADKAVDAGDNGKLALRDRHWDNRRETLALIQRIVNLGLPEPEQPDPRADAIIGEWMKALE